MKLEKITKQSENSRRRYEDACGTAHALDLVGERWALLVVRELMLGPKRFGDLKAALAGISANVLTQRLEGLEESGIVIRRKLPPPASVQVYELTEWGYEAAPIFEAMGRWAARSPHHDPSLPISPVSLFLSFRTMFDAARAKDFEAKIGVKFGEETFLVTIADGRIETVRGETESADVVFDGSSQTLAAAVYGRQSLDDLTGALTVSGDRKKAERFLTLFPLPPKVTPAGA
jgi:DNA-binding HxlR family transcriptional regulator